LLRALHLGGDLFYRRGIERIGQHFDVFYAQGLVAAAVVLIRPDCDQVGADGLDLALNGGADAVAYGEQGDDGGDADDDAQHGQRGAHLVGQQAIKGG
jgi:hypothetical protein